MLSAGSKPAPQAQEQEQTQVRVGIPGSKGPLGLLTVLLAQDNVSESGYDGTSRAGRAMFTPRLATAVLSVPVNSCVCQGPSGLCGLCGLALNGWLGWKLSAASMTGKTAIGKEVRMDGGLFLLNHRGP